MAYWSYCFVVGWVVSQFSKGIDLLVPSAPWYVKKSITFSDMLAAARRSHFGSRISRDPSKHLTNPKFGSHR